MANKIKLGARPGSFKRAVSFPMLDGTEGVITWSFKYRTRREYGEMVDKLFAQMREAANVQVPSGDTEEAFSMLQTMHKTDAENAKQMLDIADGWDLEAPFDAESLEQLASEVPAAITAATAAYRAAIVEGRSGN